MRLLLLPEDGNLLEGYILATWLTLLILTGAGYGLARMLWDLVRFFLWLQRQK